MYRINDEGAPRRDLSRSSCASLSSAVPPRTSVRAVDELRRVGCQAIDEGEERGREGGRWLERRRGGGKERIRIARLKATSPGRRHASIRCSGLRLEQGAHVGEDQLISIILLPRTAGGGGGQGGGGRILGEKTKYCMHHGRGSACTQWIPGFKLARLPCCQACQLAALYVLRALTGRTR